MAIKSRSGRIFGELLDGSWAPIKVDESGALTTSLKSPKSAFGEIVSISPTPVGQMDFVYGINTNILTTTLTGSGTASAENSLLSVSTTAAASSSAMVISKRYIKYRAGQGALGRFTALFTTGVANSKQYAGLGTASISDGFFFGYNGASFGICHVNATVETWLPQASWNKDVCDGLGRSGILLDPTKLNVYQVQYQYLGAGNIFFYIENVSNGELALVHEIKYAGANTTPSLRQPSLNMLWKVINTSNTSAILIKSASAALFLEGERAFLGAKYGKDNNKASITTRTNIITLKNCTTFNTVTNRSQVRISTISFGSNTGGAGSGIATLVISKGSTLGGSPSYATIDGTTGDGGVTITSGQSIVSFDVAGTTITGGVDVFNAIVAVGNSANIDVTAQDIFLNPGEIMTFSISSSQSSTVGVGVSWNEDI